MYSKKCINDARPSQWRLTNGTPGVSSSHQGRERRPGPASASSSCHPSYFHYNRVSELHTNGIIQSARLLCLSSFAQYYVCKIQKLKKMSTIAVSEILINLPKTFPHHQFRKKAAVVRLERKAPRGEHCLLSFFPVTLSTHFCSGGRCDSGGHVHPNGERGGVCLHLGDGQPGRQQGQSGARCLGGNPASLSPLGTARGTLGCTGSAGPGCRGTESARAGPGAGSCACRWVRDSATAGDGPAVTQVPRAPPQRSGVALAGRCWWQYKCKVTRFSSSGCEAQKPV